MSIIKYERRYAKQVADLLNNYLPFQEENEQTIDEAGGVQLLAVEDGEVIGYIAGYAMDDVTIEFPFFHEELELLLTTLKSGISYYTSHLVVHPNARGKGIGKQLVARYMEAVKQKADVVVVVGWVKSDTNKWDAEKQFMSHGFTHKLYIKRYFEPYNVYCPSCQGTCYCDANIVWKILR